MAVYASTFVERGTCSVIDAMYAGPPTSSSSSLDLRTAPVGPGETLTFVAELATTGDPDLQLALIVKTPPHPNGGFQILSSANGIFLGFNYGADHYNAPAGIFRSTETGRSTSRGGRCRTTLLLG